MAAVNGSYASPLATAEYPAQLNNVTGGFLSQLYDGLNGWSIFAAILLVLVLYDQCKLASGNNCSLG